MPIINNVGVVVVASFSHRSQTSHDENNVLMTVPEWQWTNAASCCTGRRHPSSSQKVADIISPIFRNVFDTDIASIQTVTATIAVVDGDTISTYRSRDGNESYYYILCILYIKHDIIILLCFSTGPTCQANPINTQKVPLCEVFLYTCTCMWTRSSATLCYRHVGHYAF